jgi:hypothetical protein
MATKAAVKKTRVTAKDVAEHRARAGKDLSPKWDGCETWDTDTFYKHFRSSMDWYRMESSGRDLKPKVINWMSVNGFTKDQIKAFKDTKDWRSNLTMGAIAACLLKGMTPYRADFNNGKNIAQWLSQQINTVIESGREDIVEEEAAEKKENTVVVTIQERVREATYKMTEEIEDAIESFSTDPETFDPKAFKLVNLLRGKQVKAAHARIIKDFYQRQHDEYAEVLEGKCDQLKEAYSHRTKAQIKKIFAFHQEILSACDMLMQEAKINRKPRKVKAVSKDKIVAKLKYLKQHEPLKLVSINPADIVGAKELWIYNTKTRKLGKYIAEDFKDLSIKGTSITGFSANKSVQKTLRKPEDQLKEFKNAGKVALRKFLEDIKAVDIKLNGRINEDTVLLKIV